MYNIHPKRIFTRSYCKVLKAAENIGEEYPHEYRFKITLHFVFDFEEFHGVNARLNFN